ncbi:MAG: SGNH/GDSL hydrolase family protein [Fibrobacteres bacterium]|nr:SGNH/GDSL hydrolase family protein [Fibrobacterota bacterium]
MADDKKGWLQIGVWGDSLVHGGIDGEKGGWVSRLKLHLMANGLGDHCFSLGIGGQSSSEVLDRIPVELKARREHVDHVIVSVGLNDLLNKPKIVSPEKFADNLRKIVRIIHRSGKRAWILSMTPCDRTEAANWRVMVDISKKVAIEEKADWIDMSAAFPNSDLVDGVHPGPAGHEKMFRLVLEALNS